MKRDKIWVKVAAKDVSVFRDSEKPHLRLKTSIKVGDTVLLPGVYPVGHVPTFDYIEQLIKRFGQK